MCVWMEASGIAYAQYQIVPVQVYAQDTGSGSGRSTVRHTTPTPPLSHLDSTASAPDTGEGASSFPSQYLSGGPEAVPTGPVIQQAAEAATVSFGAHTTMKPQLLASAFSAADDPPLSLLQQSWQQDALWKAGKVARVPAPTRECGPYISDVFC